MSDIQDKTMEEKQAFAQAFFDTCEEMKLKPTELAAVVKVAADLSEPICDALAAHLDG